MTEQTINIRRAAAQDANVLSVLAATTNYETYFETDEPEDLANYTNSDLSVRV